MLIAMSYSLVHDFTFSVLHDEQHSVKEYISELTIPAANEDIHDIHFEYHTAFVFPLKFIFLQNVIREETVFAHNKVFLSRSHFEFFKPPIT
ncbi:MAG: hypothetical protein COA44_00130 [Arcobacter sp.]|nr:MAG: hypothetical protein COA44_00130 [Arcobacter sp.]